MSIANPQACSLCEFICHLTYCLLALSSKVFDGTIPSRIGDLEDLEIFTASNNRRRDSNGLSGQLPASLGDLYNLLEFDVSDNSITGLIPAALGQCESLEILHLQENSLEGDVPAALGNLYSLTSMNLRNNDLEGQVPDDLCSADADPELSIQVDCSVTCAEGCCTDYNC